MVRIILPHQLFHRDYSEEKVFLVEHPRFFSDFNFHKKKLVLHRAAMKAFQDKYDTEYIEHGQDTEKLFKQSDEVVVGRPEDHKLRKWFQKKAEEHGCVLEFERTPMFMNEMSYNREYFRENSYYQLSYYKEQRRRHGILMEEDSPLGGKWSFDPENREKMPENHEKPEIPRFSSGYVEEAKEYVKENFPENPGKLDDFIYPVTREQALTNLEDFLENRLENFGRFQDAFDKDLDYGYHSLLSPALNTGLLTPKEVVDKTIEKHEKKDYPLNSLEGFIRQIIGWREFIRALYHLEPEMKQENFWKADNKLPEQYYTGDTGLPPVDRSIERVLRTGYTHHIERLMVLGNTMLLLEIDPDEVYNWFMELFIDSYDWVMTPNIYGMSQYSYTEMMTKPYISSSNYVRKMSNYESGDWEDYWDGLYWRFINKYREEVSEIPRMGFMVSTLERMGQDTIENHMENAERFKQSLEKD